MDVVAHVFRVFANHFTSSSEVCPPLISSRPSWFVLVKSEAWPNFIVGYRLIPKRLHSFACRCAQLKHILAVHDPQTICIVLLDATRPYLFSTVNACNPNFWLRPRLRQKECRYCFIGWLELLTTGAPDERIVWLSTVTLALTQHSS